MSSARFLASFFGAILAGVVLWVLILVAASGLPFALLLSPERIPQSILTVYTIGLYLWVMALIGFFWRKVAGRPWKELGLQPSLGRFASGLAMGLAVVAVVLALQLALGWVRFAPPPQWPLAVFAVSSMTALGFALSEELIFRGFFLRTLTRDHPAWRAALLSSLLYAALHFLRPNLTWHDLLLFIVLAIFGFVLAQLTLRTGSIWLPVGLHASWVWFFASSQQLSLWHWIEKGLGHMGGVSAAIMGLLILIPALILGRRFHAEY